MTNAWITELKKCAAAYRAKKKGNGSSQYNKAPLAPQRVAARQARAARKQARRNPGMRQR